MKYDPERGPDPDAWLELDESVRIALAYTHHQRSSLAHRPGMNRRVHAAIHAVVETQLASESPPEVRAALARLCDAGLSRHEAVHAIADVLANAVFDALRTEKQVDPRALGRNYDALTRESWEASAPEGDEALAPTDVDAWLDSEEDDEGDDDAWLDAALEDGTVEAVPGPEPCVRQEPRVGRNDPCPCGSGKKWKRCHGA